MELDLVGLGNALVDVLAHIEDDDLQNLKLVKGSMNLIDEAKADAIYDKMGTTTTISGGSAANTIVGSAMLGLKTAFVGKVAQDEFGKMFAHDLHSQNVIFSSKPLLNDTGTGRSYIMVSPDGERTMNTFLGAAQKLHPDDIDAQMIAAAKITYLEGYLWDPKDAKDAFLKAAAIAHDTNRKVALTLSDTFCVDRWRPEFIALLRDGVVDMVFCNEGELKALYETSSFDAAIEQIGKDVPLAIVTRSEMGSVVVERQNVSSYPVHPVERVVDATGAGDLFAAGFLSGYIRGCSIPESIKLASLAAAEIISHMGARAQRDLISFANEEGIKFAA